MSVELFDLEQLRPTPWKNGRGSTREILSWPPGSDLDTFLWRVSVATVDADCQFSSFPGVDRTIMLLAGDGIWLRGDASDQQISDPYRLFAFSGDEAMHCTLLGQTSTDLNVMIRRDQVQATITVPTSTTTIAGDHGVILGLRGRWTLGSDVLSPGRGVHWSGAARRWPVSLSDEDTVVAAVTFRDTRPLRARPGDR